MRSDSALRIFTLRCDESIGLLNHVTQYCEIRLDIISFENPMAQVRRVGFSNRNGISLFTKRTRHYVAEDSLVQQQ